MTKYKVTLYPNWESWDYEGEANSKEEFLKEAENNAYQNCSFGANISDVKEVDEEMGK